MNSQISQAEISEILNNALKNRILDYKPDTSAVFYNIPMLEERVKDLMNQFPENSLHAIAMKANPLFAILKILKDLGAGSEVATLPELHMALETAYEPNTIVFDSPCKTLEEIEYALKKGIRINADSLEELSRIDSIIKKTPSNSIIGIRVNPQVGAGSIKSTSVADNISKFGVPLSYRRAEIISAYRQFPWLTAIHLHIGSQGMPWEMLIEGIQRVVDLCMEINGILEKSNAANIIDTFDIGGGLAVSYTKEPEPASMNAFAKELKVRVPQLFSGRFKIITEFGRYIHTNCAWAVSRIEYVKREKNHNIIMSHLGADFMLRECYNPLDWQHLFSLFDSNGNPKPDDKKEKYFIAGPLCFAGDIIGHDIELPKAEEGDLLIIHDVGAYTLSMWSRYNSRQMPKILGYDKQSISILKDRENPGQVTNFWK